MYTFYCLINQLLIDNNQIEFMYNTQIVYPNYIYYNINNIPIAVLYKDNEFNDFQFKVDIKTIIDIKSLLQHLFGCSYQTKNSFNEWKINNLLLSCQEMNNNEFIIGAYDMQYKRHMNHFN
jgi:hypothetical protein